MRTGFDPLYRRGATKIVAPLGAAARPLGHIASRGDVPFLSTNAVILADDNWLDLRQRYQRGDALRVSNLVFNRLRERLENVAEIGEPPSA